MPRRPLRFVISAGVALIGLSAAAFAQTTATPPPPAQPRVTTTTLAPAAKPAVAPAREGTAAPAKPAATAKPTAATAGATSTTKTPATTAAPAKPAATAKTTVAGAAAPAAPAKDKAAAPKDKPAAASKDKAAAAPKDKSAATPKDKAAPAPKDPASAPPKDKPKKEKAQPTPSSPTPDRLSAIKNKNQPTLEVVRLGYNRLLRPGQWAPVQLVLKNPTAKSADVEVVIFAEEPDGTRQPMVTHTQLSLPARSTRWHTTFALVDRCDRVIIELYEGGRVTSRQVTEPFQAGAREMLSVAFSAGTETYGCRQDEDAKDPVGRMRFYNPSGVEDLPNRWAGYDPIDVIIVGSLPTEGLTVSQETAIVDWVRAGGLLILSPGMLPDRYAGTVIDTISPVRVLGTRKVQDVPVLTRQYGPFVQRPEAIGLAESAVRDGVVQQREGDFPLVVVRREGAGAVAFVAVDLSSERVTGWLGLKRFYRSLIDGTDRLPRTGGTQASVVATDVLNHALGVRVLPRWSVALVMGIYLAGIVAAFHFMRGRREWAFVIVIVAAPILAIIVNFIGLAASGVTGSSIAELHVVRAKAGERSAFATSYYALLSPKESWADISLPDLPSSFFNAPIAEPSDISKSSVAAAETARETVDFMDADIKSLNQLHIRPRGMSTFESIHGATLPGLLEVKADVGADGIRVHVANRSNRTVHRAFVICNRSVASLGDLSAGDTRTVVLASGNAGGLMANFAGSGLRSGDDIERDRFLASLYMRPSGSSVINTGVMVAGWLDSSTADLKVAGLADVPRLSSRTLWLTGADLRTAPGKLLFPKGTTALTLIQPKSGFDNGKWQPTAVVRPMEAEFLVPPAARALNPSRIEFTLATAGATAVGSVEAFNVETGQYDLLLGKAGRNLPDPTPLTRSRFTLSPPQKYFQPASGAVRLRITVGPESALSISSPGARQPVTISDCDLEIEGTLE